MKRLLFGAFSAIACGSAGVLALAACDPDLTIATVPGEGGTEGGTTDAPPSPPSEGGPTSEGGAEGGGEGGSEHTIDGVNDFAPGEKFATSSPAAMGSSGYNAYVSWDDTKVYFGMSGADVGTSSASKWVLIYVDGVPGNAGSADGIAYDCGGTCTAQQAHLPFNAGFHLRWKADGQYTNLQKWNGTTWANVGPISTVARTGTFMELSITRAALGAPTKLKVHMNMLIEMTGNEWTYAGLPATSFADGKSPASFTKFYEFDLADRSTSPNTYMPK